MEDPAVLAGVITAIVCGAFVTVFLLASVRQPPDRQADNKADEHTDSGGGR